MTRKPIERTRAELLDELRDAVGEEAVEQSDIDADRVIRRRAPARLASARLLLGFAGAVAMVVAVVLILAIGSWVALAVALAAHATGTVTVIVLILRHVNQVETPDATTTARLQEEGLGDPEGALNDLVEESAGEDPRSARDR